MWGTGTGIVDVSEKRTSFNFVLEDGTPNRIKFKKELRKTQSKGNKTLISISFEDIYWYNERNVPAKNKIQFLCYNNINFICVLVCFIFLLLTNLFIHKINNVN